MWTYARLTDHGRISPKTIANEIGGGAVRVCVCALGVGRAHHRRLSAYRSRVVRAARSRRCCSKHDGGFLFVFFQDEVSRTTCSSSSALGFAKHHKAQQVRAGRTCASAVRLAIRWRAILLPTSARRSRSVSTRVSKRNSVVFPPKIAK